MIRKAAIVVLTSASLWTLFCLGLSYVPKDSAHWFSLGSYERGWTLEWNIYKGRSSVIYNTYDERGRSSYQRRYWAPSAWIVLLGLAAYPSAVFVGRPRRRWLRRRHGLCARCGTATDESNRECSRCGADVNRLLRMTVSRWFTLVALHAAVNFFAALGAVVVGAYSVAIILALIAIAAPLFGFVWGLLYTKRYNRRYLGQNYCTKCCYDLTGNISGVCPECGSAIKSAQSITSSDSSQ